MKKECNNCHESKFLEEFRKDKKKEDGLDIYCKLCRREKDKGIYNKNLERSRKQGAFYKQQARIKRNEFVLDYLKNHPCVDCGESDPVVLEFDHIKDKTSSVSQLLHRGVSIDILKQEIEKCEIRCCNCHRRKTAKDFNFYKFVG